MKSYFAWIDQAVNSGASFCTLNWYFSGGIPQIGVVHFNISSQLWRLGSDHVQQQSYAHAYAPFSDRSRHSPPSGSFWLSLVAVVSGAIVVLHGCLRTFPTCGCLEGKPVLTWKIDEKRTSQWLVHLFLIRFFQGESLEHSFTWWTPWKPTLFPLHNCFWTK